MKYLVLFFTIFLLSSISAYCLENQIDINSASLEELDQLTGIGPVKAQAIIDARPLVSIDALIDVNGIGEVTLANIKTQGLACVNNHESEEEEDEESNETEVKNDTETKNIVSIVSVVSKDPELQPIELKTDPDSEVLSKRNYPFYGLISFGFLLGLLFFIRKKYNGR